MVLVLFCITLISGAGVGVVNMITVDPIAKAKAEAEQAALAQVLPEFDAIADTVVVNEKGDSLLVNKAIKDDQVVGYAIKSSAKGFGGPVKLMVGFDTKGTIINVNVLEQTETPGLGTKMAIKGDTIEKPRLVVKNPLLRINGKLASELDLRVKKDGGDIDALTAATISSRAYVNAVAQAYSIFKCVAGESEKVEVTTGATKQNKEE